MTPEFEDFTIGVIPNGNISLKFNLVCLVLCGSYSYISIARSRIYNNIKLIGMLNMNIARPNMIVKALSPPTLANFTRLGLLWLTTKIIPHCTNHLNIVKLMFWVYRT